MIETGTAINGNEGRAKLAEEEEHHDADQNEGLAQRAHDLLDRRFDEDGGVEKHRIGEVVREALGQRVHGFLYGFRHLDRVGSWRLIDADRGGRRAVETRIAIRGVGVHLDPRHILDANHRAAGIGSSTMFSNSAGVVSRPCVLTVN